MKKNVIVKTYKVPENILTLILAVEALIEQSDTLPIEYKKEGYTFLKKIKTMAGIVENYDDYDIIDYDYNITIRNESNK